jgi:hypothetical protein
VKRLGVVAPSRPQLLPVQEILTFFRELRAANAREARQFAGMPGGRRTAAAERVVY